MISKVFHIRIDSAPGYRSDAIQKGFIENGFEYKGFNWQHYRYSYGTEILRQEVVKAAKEFLKLQKNSACDQFKLSLASV